MALELYTTLLTAALIVLPLVLWYKFNTKQRRFVKLLNKLPGPPTLPLIGNLMDILVPRNQFMAAINKHVEENKPLYRIWLGSMGEVHLTTSDHIEAIISGMSNIEKSWTYSFLHPWLGQGLLTSAGSKWHSRRKMITPTFHFSILEPFCDVFVEKSQILVEKLQQEMDLRGDTGFDICPFITRCALDIICESAMGTEIQAQEKTQSEYVLAVHDISSLTMYRGMRPWLHPDIIFYRCEAGRRYKQCLKVLHGFTDKVIQERKAAFIKASKKCPGTENEEDVVLGKKKRVAFLDLLLQASQESNQLTDRDLREEVDTFMFEGHDTTTAGMSWALFLLGAYPEVQDKAFEELDSIFQGSDRPIKMRDLQEMKYLERVIKETLRLYPSVPFIMRMLDEETECGGYLLPKEAIVIIHIFHLHRNPEYFPDPELFNPDRFLPEQVQGRHPYAYIPFSAGPRNCIGQKFALLEEKTVLATVLRKFKVRSLEKREDVTVISDLILKPESGIKVVLTPR